ncbi:Uncharacterised protein [Mycobacteroides abscessus subsp. abscessus]|nr:Uncharacterised protein [Mycobacteroides abscessus subsp. abscessus]
MVAASADWPAWICLVSNAHWAERGLSERLSAVVGSISVMALSWGSRVGQSGLGATATVLMSRWREEQPEPTTGTQGPTPG